MTPIQMETPSEGKYGIHALFTIPFYPRPWGDHSLHLVNSTKMSIAYSLEALVANINLPSRACVI